MALAKLVFIKNWLFIYEHRDKVTLPKNSLDTFLRKSKTAHVAKKDTLIVFWSELPGLH